MCPVKDSMMPVCEVEVWNKPFSGVSQNVNLHSSSQHSILPSSYMAMDMAATGLTTTLSTKGQVILPKEIRDQLQWDAGTRLSVEHTADGVLLKPLTAAFARTRPEDVFGCLPHKGEPKSVEEMEAGIATEAKRRHARGRY